MFETDQGPSRWKLLGPGWWVAGVALTVLIAIVPRMSATTITLAGLAAAVVFLFAGEAWRRGQSSDPISVVRGQAWTGAAVISLGLATGPIAAQLQAGVLQVTSPFVIVVWTISALVVTLGGAQMFMATRRLVLDGRRDRERLLASERETHETELLVLQQKLEPQLLLRVLAGIADQAERHPREAERAVEHLAVFLRKSLTLAPALTVPLSDEVARSKEYADVLEMCGTNVPITWQIDNDAEEAKLPGGTLSTFLNYAISRCLATEGASITVRAYQHAARFYLIVRDNAAPDPPMLAEPEGLTHLRRRLGTPPQRWARVETSVILEVDGTPAGTTQTLSIRLPEAA